MQTEVEGRASRHSSRNPSIPNPDCKKWISSQSLSVEKSYCVLFLLGWLLVPKLTTCPYRTMDTAVDTANINSAGGDGGQWNSAGMELTFRVVQLASHALWCITLYKQDVWEKGRWYACAFSGFVVPLGILVCWLMVGQGPCGGEMNVEELQDRLLSPVGMVLKVLVYQVGVSWQGVLLAFHTLLVMWACHHVTPLSGWDFVMKTVYKIVTCVFFPCSISFIVQICLKHEYMKIVPKLASKHMDNEGSVEAGETSASEAEPPAVQQLPASPARTRVSPPVSAQTPQVTPKLKIDVAGWLKEGIASDASRSSMTFFEYKPVVACETRTIKVYNKDATDMEIQQYAVNYAANIAHRKSVAGKLTVVKGVGVRGCILLMAGVLQCPDDIPQDFHDEAAELVDCLSDELKNETMDVTIGEWTGRVVDGVVESVEIRKGHVEVPEVVLVSEPCCVQGVSSKMDIYFSEGSGNWDSLNVVTVVENVVKQKDLLHESKHQQLLVNVESTVEQRTGQIHAVGVIDKDDGEKSKTFVSTMAPFLMLPKCEAQELNGLFTQTVLKSGPNSDTHRKMVWQEHFKPFCLDMHFLLGMSLPELQELMSKESELRSEYLSILCNVIKFLHGCDATQTVEYLLRILAHVGVVLHVDGKTVTDDLGQLGDQIESIQAPFEPAQAGPSFDGIPTGSDGGKGKFKGSTPNSTERNAPTTAEFDLWNGFKDPTLEIQYRADLKRSTVMVDFMGTMVGLCLVPLLWQLARQGHALYLCPVITQFIVCNMWLAYCQKTYVHNRQSVMYLHCLVRLVAFLGQARRQGWPLLGQSNSWICRIAMMTWVAIVKPKVMKMLVRDHILFSASDLIGWSGVFVVTMICGDVWKGLLSILCTLGSILFASWSVYRSEHEDRLKFADKFEVQTSKPSNPK